MNGFMWHVAFFMWQGEGNTLLFIATIMLMATRQRREKRHANYIY